jgi:hypothetical protein
MQQTSRGTRWDNGPVETSLGDDVDLNGGVTARVVDGACVNLLDRHLHGGVLVKRDKVCITLFSFKRNPGRG